MDITDCYIVHEGTQTTMDGGECYLLPKDSYGLCDVCDMPYLLGSEADHNPETGIHWECESGPILNWQDDYGRVKMVFGTDEFGVQTCAIFRGEDEEPIAMVPRDVLGIAYNQGWHD